MSIQHRLQTKERITAIIGIALLGLIAGGSYWFSLRLDLDNLKYIPSLTSPDHRAQDVVVTDFMPSGQAQSRLMAQSLEHFADGSLKASHVRLYTLDPKRASVVLKANALSSNDGLETLQLTGSVTGQQAPFNGQPALYFKTQSLTAWLDTYQLTSQAPTELKWGANITTSDAGFVYDHITRQITLNGNVHSTWYPNTLRAKAL